MGHKSACTPSWTWWRLTRCQIFTLSVAPISRENWCLLWRRHLSELGFPDRGRPPPTELPRVLRPEAPSRPSSRPSAFTATLQATSASCRRISGPSRTVLVEGSAGRGRRGGESSGKTRRPWWTGSPGTYVDKKKPCHWFDFCGTNFRTVTLYWLSDPSHGLLDEGE